MVFTQSMPAEASLQAVQQLPASKKLEASSAPTPAMLSMHSTTMGDAVFDPTFMSCEVYTVSSCMAAGRAASWQPGQSHTPK